VTAMFKQHGASRGFFAIAEV